MSKQSLALICLLQLRITIAAAATAHRQQLEGVSLLSVRTTQGRSIRNVAMTTIEQKPPLKVAFAVFITDIGTGGWKDAIDILAFGIKKAADKSKHQLDLLALSPDTLPADKEEALLAAGFKQVLRRPVPVPAALVERQMSREHMERVMGHSESNNAFLQSHETIKYWGLALTQYDRVLVLDADTMVLDPMDELMERGEDFIGTYDHGLDLADSTMPPTQGGFLLFRPNQTDFETVKDLTRQGDWDGAGWKRSGIGFCYGGVGPDGLLSYYFNQAALDQLKKVGKTQLPEGIAKVNVPGSRMLAVDRSVYDVVLNERLRKELDDSGADHTEAINEVKSAHFTGDCVKPWTCTTPRGWMCAGLFQKWWDLRSELEASRGFPKTTQHCDRGKYVPIGSSK